MNALMILDNLLNSRRVEVVDYYEDPDGKKHRVVNKDETEAAQIKADAIKERFSEWIWEDADRRKISVRSTISRSTASVHGSMTAASYSCPA